MQLQTGIAEISQERTNATIVSLTINLKQYEYQRDSRENKNKQF